MICPHPAVLNSAAMRAPTPQPHHKRQSRAAGSCTAPKMDDYPANHANAERSCNREPARLAEASEHGKAFRASLGGR
jgi:hypothetical protein